MFLALFFSSSRVGCMLNLAMSSCGLSGQNTTYGYVWFSCSTQAMVLLVFPLLYCLKLVMTVTARPSRHVAVIRCPNNLLRGCIPVLQYKTAALLQ